MTSLRRKYKGDMTMRMLAAAILACLDKLERRDPSVGIYYEDGKVVKGKGRK